MNGKHALSLWLALLLTGCGSAPVAQAIYGPQQTRAGAEAARALEEQGALLSEPGLVGYVREIGIRLALAAPADAGRFEFNVLDMQEPNAFALPGGHVYVSRGLLVLLDSEDELAGVLGHEIGHVVARHHVKQAAHDAPFLPVRIATGVGGALLSTVSPALGGLVAGTGKLTSALFSAPYSRDQESEADDIGQRLAAKSGWDPLGISRVMDALGAEERLHGGDPGRISFLSTHPASAERSERTRRLAAELSREPIPPIAAGRESFLRRLDGLVVGAAAKHGVFEGDSFLHPELAFALRFPGTPDWERANTDSAVAAVREQPDAAIVLEAVAQGDDPLAAAREHLPGDARLDSPPEAGLVNGLQAARARAGLRDASAHIWWIALEGHIYRITGVTPAARSAELADTFVECAESFHRLTPGERAAIREDRLRTERARAGDTLATLLQRAGSRWAPEAAAVANGLALDAPLESGRLVKITRPERYGP